MSTSTKSPIHLTPFCGDLRSKKFYMNDAIPTKEADFMDPSGHCWCYHTNLPIGPDGNRAEPQSCNSTRKCYRSGFDTPKPY